MALRVFTDIPGGNARGITVETAGEFPEITFVPAPQGGNETLWFCLRIKELQPGENAPAKVRLTLKHYGNLLGAGSPADCVPVYRPQGQGWHRAGSGQAVVLPDGQVSASWTIPYPAPATDVALCFPYDLSDVRTLLAKSKGYWKTDEIGLSREGRPLLRLSNDYGAPGGKRHGLYLVARQHAGETPGSWVLDGLLQHLSRQRRDPFLVWAVPLADADGVVRGDCGKDAFPCDLNRAWGTPPMRHETLVYQRDMARWSERCRPALGIDFHAPGAAESDGIYCHLPPPDKFPDAHRAAEKWANLICQELGPDYAAHDFKRAAAHAPDGETPSFTTFCAERLGLCALAIETPYGRIGGSVLTQKQYREAGERIARALTLKAGG
ncbi:MAG: hypothetical protein FJ225_01490 [Lentisphaerae bacterium]|nr:hypothetical protein [Lentisphaerota bacterium]